MSAEPTDRLRALTAARDILRQNPGASMLEAVALGWLEGRIDLCQELRPTLEPKSAVHEYDCICQRCGRRDGSTFLIEPPADGFVKSVCFHCSAGDEPRAA